MNAHLHSIYLSPHHAGDAEELPDRIALNLESFKRLHPAFAHSLYGNESGRDFIRRHFDRDTLEAYDELVPLAYRADLLRYCLLYQRGGIYADLSVDFFTPLLDDPGEDRLLLFRDGYSAAPWIVSNSLMYAPAREQVFEHCIRSIIEHTRRKYYGTNQLCPTGPNLLGQHLASAVPLYRLSCGETLRINKNPATFSWAYVGVDSEVIAVNVKRGGGLQSLGGPANDYNQLYAARTIYRSELPPVLRWSAQDYEQGGFIRPSHAAGVFPPGIALTGPRTALPGGRYRARFLVRKAAIREYAPIDFQIDVCTHEGGTVLFRTPPRRTFPAAEGSTLEAEFQLPESLDGVEVRVQLLTEGAFRFEALELDRL